MPIGTDFNDLLWDRVVVNLFSTMSDYGSPVWASAASTYRAYVDFGQHKVLGVDGQDVTAALTVYVGPSSSGALPPTLTPKDQITLSASWSSLVPRIILSERFADESSGQYILVTHCA